MYDLDQGHTRNVNTGRGVRKVCSLSPNLFHFYECFNKEALEGFFYHGPTAPQWAKTSALSRTYDHTQTHHIR